MYLEAQDNSSEVHNMPRGGWVIVSGLFVILCFLFPKYLV